MRIKITMLALAILFSCGKSMDERIYGSWEINNRFYRASYRIDEVDGVIVGKVLNYDDGTTRYKWNESEPRYVFQNLKPENGLFVDAVSGATTKAGNRNIEIEILHKDTLNAIIFVSNHPRPEIWTRIK